MAIKIINSILILFAACVASKQGYNMISGKPEMVIAFSKWGFSDMGMMGMGIVTLFSVLMMLNPQTFLLGNFLSATSILLIISLHLRDSNLEGAVIEFPFLF